MDSLVLLGSCCILCLLPLSLYLLFLSHLHSRRKPSLLTGRWDFACLLMGLSGFLLMLGPLVLALVDATWRAAWLSGSFQQIRVVVQKSGTFWSVAAASYVACLFSTIFLLLRSRTSVSVVYGVSPAIFEELLTMSLERLERAWRRVGRLLEIGSKRDDLSPGRDIPGGQYFGSAAVKVECFDAMSNATLRWDEADSPIRDEVEAELERIFDRVETPGSPVAGWFLTSSLTIFVMLMVGLVYLVIMTASGPRRG